MTSGHEPREWASAKECRRPPVSTSSPRRWSPQTPLLVPPTTRMSISKSLQTSMRKTLGQIYMSNSLRTCRLSSRDGDELRTDMSQRDERQQHDQRDCEENKGALIPPRCTARPLFKYTGVMLPCSWSSWQHITCTRKTLKSIPISPQKHKPSIENGFPLIVCSKELRETYRLWSSRRWGCQSCWLWCRAARGNGLVRQTHRPSSLRRTWHPTAASSGAWFGWSSRSKCPWWWCSRCRAASPALSWWQAAPWSRRPRWWLTGWTPRSAPTPRGNRRTSPPPPDPVSCSATTASSPWSRTALHLSSANRRPSLLLTPHENAPNHAVSAKSHTKTSCFCFSPWSRSTQLGQNSCRWEHEIGSTSSQGCVLPPVWRTPQLTTQKSKS